MDHAFALQDVNPVIMAELEGKSVIEMIGEVLAAVARYLDRRIGGPGALRRLASIAVAFAVGVIVLLVKRQATAVWTVVASAGNRLSGHLAHPPSAWAAP